MNTTCSIFLKIITLPIIIIATTASAMDGYPQLQLQEPNQKNIKSVNATLTLASYPAYLSSSCLNDQNLQVVFKGRPHRYLNDPSLFVLISFEKNIIPEKSIPMPAKQLFNLNDESIIQFHLLDTTKPHENLLINARCKKINGCDCAHPMCAKVKIASNGKNFYEQFEFIMSNFYQTPHCELEAEYMQKLITEKVITPEVDLMSIGIGRNLLTAKCSHGEKGCSDRKTFIERIQKPKARPYGTSLYQMVTQRQLGTRPRPATTITPNRILDNCLRVIELETIAENNLLDECFCELQTSCLLTSLFIKKASKLMLEDNLENDFLDRCLDDFEKMQTN